MKSYLTDRKQKCQLDETMLSEVQITCGIIQGSILGPLFFLLYVNDLPDCLRQATVHGLFADDTNLTVSGNALEEVELAINSDLATVKEWLLANKLTLNVAKTEFMLIGSNYKLRNLHSQINEENLKQV